ncbi:Rhomboid family protein [Ekhidna lutea]|uniref:Rhomboid family protein n=1 Tax=Ekhidna lutea TaxID=447679 RepID=A0A239IJJ8_EKHLU|nr:rhomboid family intramembrane serine protease [Ekhidna lutea]SNS93797.1 Rhomboid family protein [Ekhidna lutea]
MFRRLTPVAKNILIINIAILLLASVLRLPLNDWFGLRVIYSSEFAPYQFLTYMWLHGGMWHLVGNMIAVLVFAPMLETVWGSKRFLIFYLVCGIGAGILYGAADAIEKLPLKNAAEAYMQDPSPEAFESFVINNKGYINVARAGELIDLYYESAAYESQTVAAVRSIYQGVVTNGTMVGASGAVFGILFAFAFLFPNTELFLLFPPIPIKAKYLVFFYAMYELYAEFNRMPGDNVAHLAHLSGMLIAFILLKLWKNNTRRFY